MRECALAGLVNDGLAGVWVEFWDDVVSRLAADEETSKWALATDT